MRVDPVTRKSYPVHANTAQLTSLAAKPVPVDNKSKANNSTKTWPFWLNFAICIIIFIVWIAIYEYRYSAYELRIRLASAFGSGLVPILVGGLVSGVIALTSKQKITTKAFVSVALFAFAIELFNEFKTTNPPAVDATTILASSMEAHAQQWYKIYPRLDPNAPNANQAAIDQIIGRRNWYMQLGMEPTTALDKAVQDIAPQYFQPIPTKAQQ